MKANKLLKHCTWARHKALWIRYNCSTSLTIVLRALQLFHQPEIGTHRTGVQVHRCAEAEAPTTLLRPPSSPASS